MRTGKIIADLPDLADQNGGDLTVAVQMGDYQTCTASLPIPTAPENWERATQEGASTLVLLQDSVPIWGAFVSQHHRDATDEVNLSLVTLEGWLDRVYVGDETFAAVGQNDIVSFLVNKYAVDGTLAGIPIRVQVVSGGSGTPRDRTYLDTDNKTLYSVLQDLAGIDGGPEWTIGWEHQTGPERYTPVFYVGDRLGAAVPAGLSAAATFEMPGPVTEFAYAVDYSTGKGANKVQAYSSGQGAALPQSSVQSLPDPDRPRFEYRWTPSTSITDVDTLTSYATARLAQIAGGTTTISLSAVADEAPRIGVDWSVGDDIGYQIGGLVPDPTTRLETDLFIDTFTDLFGASGMVLVHPAGIDSVPSFPGGLSGTSRSIGWQMTVSNTPIITPVLGLNFGEDS